MNWTTSGTIKGITAWTSDEVERCIRSSWMVGRTLYTLCKK